MRAQIRCCSKFTVTSQGVSRTVNEILQLGCCQEMLLIYSLYRVYVHNPLHVFFSINISSLFLFFVAVLHLPHKWHIFAFCTFLQAFIFPTSYVTLISCPFYFLIPTFLFIKAVWTSLSLLSLLILTSDLTPTSHIFFLDS